MYGSVFKIQSYIRRSGNGRGGFRLRGWLFPLSLNHIPFHRWGRPPANWLPNEGFSDLYLRFIPGESRQDEGVLLKLYALQAMSPLGRGRCGWREASASNCNDGGYVSAKAGDVVVIAKLVVQVD